MPHPSRRTLLLAAFSALALVPLARAGEQGIGERIAARGRTELERLCTSTRLPGASLAVSLAADEMVTVAWGVASREEGDALTPAHRMLAGSTGKTFVAATALHLVADGKLGLDDRVAKWLGDEEWFERLPNAEALTVRHLLRHTSGIPEYYDQPDFIAEAKKNLLRTWTPEELVAWVLDDEPRCPAGEGWSYADTNFLLAGLIIERAGGEKFYTLARRWFLEPHHLDQTLPSDRRDLPHLAQGHVVLGRFLGFPPRAVADGKLACNPQFEWCGGGFVSTPRDLARWARVLYTGKAGAGEYLEAMLDGVPTGRLPGERYGLGTFLQETKAGPMVGHDGFFPGYLTSMGWFADHGFAAALQINTDDLRALGVPSVHLVLERFALIVVEELAR